MTTLQQALADYLRSKHLPMKGQGDKTSQKTQAATTGQRVAQAIADARRNVPHK